MSEYLPDDKIKFHGNVDLEDILNTPGDSNVGYFSDVDLEYSDEIKENTENFPLAPENKISPQDKDTKHMKDIEPSN